MKLKELFHNFKGFTSVALIVLYDRRKTFLTKSAVLRRQTRPLKLPLLNVIILALIERTAHHHRS